MTSTQPWPIIGLEQVDSTNRVLREKLQAGELSQGVVWAKEQTAGRGRLGRSWLSPEGGLYYSIATPLSQPHVSPPLLGFAAGLAAHDYLTEQGVEGLAIKWPNDLVICDAQDREAKLGGMLSEFVVEGVDEPHVIVGLGINVNADITLPTDALAAGPSQPLPPTSLRTHTGRQWEVAALVEGMTARLRAGFARLLDPDEGTSQVAQRELHQRWEAVCSTLGKRVRIEASGKQFEGLAEGIEPSFALRVRLASEAVQIVQAGDCIHLRGAPSA